MKLRRLFNLLIFLIIAAGFSCRNNHQNQIAELVDYYIENENFNGTVRVYKNQNVLFSKVYGYGDFNTKRKLTSESSFRIGSVSKTFTAVSILILNERGKLVLSDSLGKFITFLPDHYDKVTIGELLSHTSGIPNYLDDYPSIKDTLHNSDAIDSLRKKDNLHFQPGSKFKYCNSGYMILGLIIETITQQSLKDFISENILQPLEMNDTYFIDYNNFMQQDRAYSHDPTGKLWEIPLFVKGDGGMVSTTDDLFKWYTGLIENKVIADTSLDLATKQHQLRNGELINYGLGFEINPTNQGFNMVGHQGGLGGTGVYFVFESKKENLIIAMSNNSCKKTGELVEGISMILNDFEYDAKNELPTGH